MENSKIEWTDHTFNPWIGCTKVSPGCANCYAEQLMDKRLGKVNWGPGNPRQRTSQSNWQQVERWNKQAGLAYKAWEDAMEDRDSGATEANMPRRPRVFVASLADWLDPEVPIEWLADLLDLVRRCQHLDFLMLTKRPELWKKRLEAICICDTYSDRVSGEWAPFFEETGYMIGDWLDDSKPIAPANVWVGTSVEDQQRADERIPALLKIPAKVRFLSCEPLLGPVDLDLNNQCDLCTSWNCDFHGPAIENPICMEKIHWVICGGESGSKARPMHPDWARLLRDQCNEEGVPFFMKQMGGTRKPFPEIPADLMVREFPKARNSHD
jgi:protein gp37